MRKLMRGLLSTISLIVAIGGLLVVIGYGASNAYLNFRDVEANLYNSLLMSSVAPNGWTGSRATGIDYQEQFVTPCLQTPLLEGASISGRGAATYVPPVGQQGSIQAYLLQTSQSNARSIMAEVGRDTENNCQRGVTVGTVESATVEMVDIAPADQALLVSSDRVDGEEVLRQVSLLFHDGEYLGLLSFDATDSARPSANAAVVIAAGLVSQIENPPTDAELEAAGVFDQPTAAERINAETGELLSAFGRFPIEVGLVALGFSVLLLYVFGARLSRTSEALASSRSIRPSSLASPTLDDYAKEDHQAFKSYSTSPPLETEIDDIHEVSDDYEHDDDDVLEPPPPILNFPQKPIEEKLKILKEARLKEPRREHRAVRDVTPDVDWTEEISKDQPRQAGQSTQARPAPVSRKVLLKKLRTNQTEN